MYCVLCGRDTSSDSYTYNVPGHSASQGSCTSTIVKDAINVCASCNWFFDGTTAGRTAAMESTGVGANFSPFRELPKDFMLVWMASCCSGEAGNSLSGWFRKMIWLMSTGGTYVPY